MKDENWIKSGVFEENTPTSIKDKMEGKTHIFVVVEASVTSTKIGSFWGSANKGLTGAESNAWDNNSAPRKVWDAMFDNYERTESGS